MAGLLSDYLAAWVLRPRRYGLADCALFAADWVRLCRGVDPAAPWRGRYRSPRGALRLVREAGGFVALADSALAACGIGRTEAPRAGDVALVRAPCDREAFGCVGAIVVSDAMLVAMPEERGGLVYARMAQADVLAAWRV